MDNQLPTEAGKSARPGAQTFNRIALCLSGGGYRAAAFHLGMLDMLDELKLLGNVKIMSTASGGTIVAAPYALSKIEKECFPKFFDSFLLFLKNVNVIREAMDKATAVLRVKTNCNISLIHFAAEVYDEKLFCGKEKRFAEFLDNKGEAFDDLIFNATELNRGNNFRFRAADGGIIGVQGFSIPKDTAKKLLVGDIIASSSCFPGAFDPFIFPDEFHLDVEKIKKELESGFTTDDGKHISLPIMDGGIFDNQGVYSVLLSNNDDKPAKPKVEKEGEKTKPVRGDPDLVIISDSNPINKNLYPAPMPKWKLPYLRKALPFLPKGYLSKKLSWAVADLLSWVRDAAGLGILGAAGFIAVTLIYLACLTVFLSQNYQQVFQNPLTGIIAIFVPAIVVLAIAVLCGIGLKYLFDLKKWLSYVENFIDKQSLLKIDGYPPFPVWELAKRSNIPGIIKLVETRLRSTLALTTDVFLKRVRSLGTDVILGDEKIGPLVTFNYINDLDFYTNVKKRNEDDQDKEVEPTEELIEITKKAGQYQTNLWCTTHKELENVVFAGQISICYSLLRHFWDKAKSDRAKIQKENDEKEKRGCGEPQGTLPSLPNSEGYEYQELYDQVKEKWREFKEEKRTTYKRLPEEEIQDS
jgi:predicted acylesterase/phospholipase RssA